MSPIQSYKDLAKILSRHSQEKYLPGLYRHFLIQLKHALQDKQKITEQEFKEKPNL